MPKYFVKLHAAMRSAARHNFAGFPVLKPSIQKYTDHTQKAIIIVSHMTLVLD